MGKQRRQRSWVRLLLTSVLAGAGLAVLRSLLRPAAPPAIPESLTAVVPPGDQPSRPVAEAPATTPAVALTKKSSVSERIPVTEPELQRPPQVPPGLDDPVPVPAAVPGNPQLAFVSEPTAPMYVPPANEGSRWDPPTGPEWLPGFGPGGTLPHDPWTSTGTLPAEPTGVPFVESDGIGARLREWRYQTPRRQIVFTILGTVCVIAAIVATVLVLTL